MEKGDYMQFECGDKLHLTVFRTRKKPVYILDNCVNPDKLDHVESCGERYLVPKVIEMYRTNKSFCDTANQRRAGCKIEKRSLRKYRNIFMGLAQLLIFVNSQLLWADIHKKKTFDAKTLRDQWIDSVVTRLERDRASRTVRKSRRKTMTAIKHALMGRFGLHKLEK